MDRGIFSDLVLAAIETFLAPNSNFLWCFLKFTCSFFFATRQTNQPKPTNQQRKMAAEKEQTLAKKLKEVKKAEKAAEAAAELAKKLKSEADKLAKEIEASKKQAEDSDSVVVAAARVRAKRRLL